MEGLPGCVNFINNEGKAAAGGYIDSVARICGPWVTAMAGIGQLEGHKRKESHAMLPGQASTFQCKLAEPQSVNANLTVLG